jgi:hypothetical protein
MFGGGSLAGKMIGLNGTFDNGAYNYNANAESMGAQWDRVGVWGDDAALEYTGCNGSDDTSGDPPDNPTYYLSPSAVNSSNCGVPRVANLLAAADLHLFPLVNDYGTSFVQQGTCSIQGDTYSQCLAACSDPSQVANVTCTDQLSWVQNAVHTATTYAQGGTFWQGRTDYGSPVIEMGNEVYLGASTDGGTNGTCGGPYNEPDDECQNPGAYAQMLKLASTAVSAATDGHIKLLASQLPLYMATDGTQHYWLADMQAAVPNIESYLGGVVAHPYGDIPPNGSFPGICTTNTSPCTPNSTPKDWTYQALAEVHSEWSLPVYITEVGQKAASTTPGNGQVGFTEQCQAMNYYFNQFKQNTWEAALFWYDQKDWSAFNPSADNGWSLLYGSGNPGTQKPAWNAYQAQALGKTPYNC